MVPGAGPARGACRALACLPRVRLSWGLFLAARWSVLHTHPPSHLGFTESRQLAALDTFPQARSSPPCAKDEMSPSVSQLQHQQPGFGSGGRTDSAPLVRSHDSPQQTIPGEWSAPRMVRARIPKLAALNPTVAQAHVHGKPGQFPASHSFRPECRLGRLAPKIINTNGVRARATSAV